MKNALQSLEAFRGNDYHGRLVQSVEPWEIAVLRAGQTVASVPLTPTESGYLTQAITGLDQRRPLVFFRCALRQGDWARGDSAQA
ncbi:hypothetical protein [Hymenobacter sp. B1770]|uniref:hypothetical protein n=1 Tax=Hymenobacter sp. B1770 TaxID=1718788 RepID=UPI003CF85721